VHNFHGPRPLRLSRARRRRPEGGGGACAGPSAPTRWSRFHPGQRRRCSPRIGTPRQSGGVPLCLESATSSRGRRNTRPSRAALGPAPVGTARRASSGRLAANQGQRHVMGWRQKMRKTARTVSFVVAGDGATGESWRRRPKVAAQQPDTLVIGWSDDLLLLFDDRVRRTRSRSGIESVSPRATRAPQTSHPHGALIEAGAALRVPVVQLVTERKERRRR